MTAHSKDEGLAERVAELVLAELEADNDFPNHNDVELIARALLSSSTALREMREAGQFLLDRLSEVEITEEIAREWMGHVEPAVGRFRAAIEKATKP